MASPSQPSDIAREALRRLAARRVAPTPDNYRALYHEIAGTADAEAFPERALRSLAARLPRVTPEQAHFAQQLEAAVGNRDWSVLSAALSAVLREFETMPPAWNALIADLLAQMERRHAGLTAAGKREALEHILASSGSDPEHLFERMTSLLRSWARTPAGAEPSVLAADPPAPEGAPPAVREAAKTTAAAVTPANPEAGEELRELIAQLVESSLGLLLVDAPQLAEEAAALAAEVRAARDTSSLAALARRLRQFTFRLQFVAEDQTELKAALQKLLQLVIENITELVDDDQWLKGQIGAVLGLFGQPLSLRRLDDVERRLKEVIHKQGALRKQLGEAKDRLKTMLAGFVDHLASFSESTSDYHDKVERCAAKISSANDLNELSAVIDEVMRETHVIQVNAQRSRDDLAGMRSRLDQGEREIARLQNELAQTSEMMRHDPLTGALNRKGLEEAIERELARSHRRQSPMCIALLDVDNFKDLNDKYGHQTGDDVLAHLAQVIRESLRPQDTLARYGGEEFLILLPDTALQDAVAAVTRLQRSLTKKFFLHRNDRLLVTFSAGVAAIDAQETRKEAIARADAAMYQAKKAGKNRVVASG